MYDSFTGLLAVVAYSGGVVPYGRPRSAVRQGRIKQTRQALPPQKRNLLSLGNTVDCRVVSPFGIPHLALVFLY